MTDNELAVQERQVNTAVDMIADRMAEHGLNGKHHMLLNSRGLPEELSIVLRNSDITVLEEIHSGAMAVSWKQVQAPTMTADILPFPKRF